MDLGLKGKVVLCMASAAGLGKGIVTEMAREGAKVMICTAEPFKEQLYAAQAGVDQDTHLTPALAAKVLLAEGYGNIVYVNKCETRSAWENAETLARLLPLPVVAGSLLDGRFHRFTQPVRSVES